MSYMTLLGWYEKQTKIQANILHYNLLLFKSVHKISKTSLKK